MNLRRIPRSFNLLHLSDEFIIILLRFSIKFRRVNMNISTEILILIAFSERVTRYETLNLIS